MKTIIKPSVIFLAAAAFATASYATEMTSIEGIVTFDQGDFYLVSENDNIMLTGMSRDDLNLYSGQATIITGEAHSDEGDVDMMEVYKIQSEKKGQIVTLYDWEIVNNELYEN